MRHFHFALALASLLFSSAQARADLPPPDTSGCRMASAGDPCDPDNQADAGTKAGTCRKSTCSKVDYANWNHDASATPPVMEYECLKCLTSSDAGTDAASATGGAGGTAGTTGTGGATGGSGGAVATGGAAGSPAKSDSGCAVSGSSSAFGPWLLAGAFAVAVLFARRRR